MRIGIDVRYLSHGIVGGVHTYVECIVPLLVQMAPEHQFFLYADTKRSFELTELPANAMVRYLPYRNALSSVFNDAYALSRMMAQDSLDVVHFPANYGFGPPKARTVITLHDHVNLLPLPYLIRNSKKDLSTIVMMTYLHVCSRRALYAADLLITVSNYSKSRIVRMSGFDSDRIVAMTHPPSPAVQKVDDEATLAEVRQKYNLSKPFVITDALKNPGALVKAWELLPEDLRKNHLIVFFSRTPALPKPVQEAITAGYAQALIRPSNTDLYALYSMARALAFPSWYEGLGLPLLEAMICGAPVVASDRGAIPEVVGDAALLSDVNDFTAMANNLQSVLSDPAEHKRLQALGYERIMHFSWDKIAREVIEVYKRALTLPRRR